MQEEAEQDEKQAARGARPFGRMRDVLSGYAGLSALARAFEKPCVPLWDGSPRNLRSWGAALHSFKCDGGHLTTRRG